MNPECAKAMHIAHGDKVMVENPHGDKTGPMPANVTERMPRRSLYMIHGFGNQSKKLKLAYNKGGSDTEVIDTYAVDPISGSTGMRVQWVRVRKATKDEELYPCAMG